MSDGARAGSAATGSLGTKTYDELKGLGDAYFDPAAGASWRWDGDQWWSYDDAASVDAKAERLASNGYGGAMWWDITGDRDNDLAGQLGDTFRAAPTGPSAPAPCAHPGKSWKWCP
ncbi:glycosyl hydrolase family 18 protein [Paraoerskovia sediminicola]|uniref:glycosyl hydrolase family 18 protein n=1 Tax=Paraoerskovia sediminicola TaxID=1138587 RepID=UPI003305719E